MNSANFNASAATDSQPASRFKRSANDGPLRVLLVDDCRLNRMLVAAVLARWGIVPTIACDGAQAVDIVQRQEFDIVLMDILMPVMDGVVATAKIRQAEREQPARPHLPIVAYTALDLGANPSHMDRVGLTAVLAKPCSPTTLHACLALYCPKKFTRSVGSPAHGAPSCSAQAQRRPAHARPSEHENSLDAGPGVASPMKASSP